RRSLGRGLPELGERQAPAACVWVAPDGHGPKLRRGRIAGPAVVSFAGPVRVRRGGVRRNLFVARPAGKAGRRTSTTYTRISLDRGEALEVRP
ncbi:MAG TPA: hypothetical protein VIJ21_01395, partial [Solirubrobacterales bacterium]